MKYVYAILLLMLAGCSAVNDPEQTASKQSDIFVGEYMSEDSVLMLLYLSPTEQQHIILNNTDPRQTDYYPYHIPSKKEGEWLHFSQVKATSSERYLCLSDDGVWYTFCFGGIGNITKAGGKTKYTLRPVRVVTMSKDTIIKL